MSWSTKDEIRFLDELGTHCSKFNKHDKKYRYRLLEGYIKSIPFRANWGVMDKEYITAYVKRQLSMEVQK